MDNIDKLGLHNRIKQYDNKTLGSAYDLFSPKGKKLVLKEAKRRNLERTENYRGNTHFYPKDYKEYINDKEMRFKKSRSAKI